MTAKAWIALDVGGANVKAAHSDGSVASRRFLLWNEPRRLTQVLEELIGRLPVSDGFALTMTAELCDCFETKAEGVRTVVDAVQGIAGTRPVEVWGVDGRFHSTEEIRGRPHLAAAANWLALATVAARIIPAGPALMIDVGSTTTDLVPLLDGCPVPAGVTDADRLKTGELVYVGVRRTPLCAVTPTLPWGEEMTGLAAELFATTLDPYLVRGEIPADVDDRDTADRRPATIEAARDRLARMICSDRDAFSLEDAQRFAIALDTAIQRRLIIAAARACRRIGTPQGVVIAGSGEFLALRVARLVGAEGSPVYRLSELWGREASSAACARALLCLHPEGGP